MKITSIRESGNNSTLRWAISTGANIASDSDLQRIVNDELFYLVTLGEVNFFEVFRLTQVYREKLKILEENRLVIPTAEALSDVFRGSYNSDPNDQSKTTTYAELAVATIEKFTNLAMQMHSDSDIIKSNATRLFLPMIARTFSVQVPISFIDLMNALDIPNGDAKRLFTESYPSNLQDELTIPASTAFKNKLLMGMIRMTDIIKYSTHYDQLLHHSKYFPISKPNGDNLYRFGLLGFYKYDPVSRAEIRCSMFKPNREEMATNMKRLKSVKSPLKLEFAIQLPIQYMQMIENYFSDDDLEIMYRSSMSTIINDGLVYEDFNTPAPIGDDEEAMEEFNNQISAYRVRIADTNTTLMNALSLMLANGSSEIDTRSAFAMLPSIYMSKAVITINFDNLKKYTGTSLDFIIGVMFEEIAETCQGIDNQINHIT